MNNLEFKSLVETAIDKLEKQNEISVNKMGSCVYLNEKRQSCIIGHMMPDDKTRRLADSEDNKDYTIVSLVINKVIPYFTNQFSSSQLQIMERLQDLHDTSGSKEYTFNDCIEEMRELSKRNYLNEKN